MTWTVNDKEFESVSALPSRRRYDYFVKRVADREEVWSLGNEEGWVVSGDDEGGEYVPVWPHPRFARACAEGPWAGTEPRAISLSDWLRAWIPGMERDGRSVVAFPTPDDRGLIVPPAGMRRDLEEELSLLE